MRREDVKEIPVCILHRRAKKETRMWSYAEYELLFFSFNVGRYKHVDVDCDICERENAALEALPPVNSSRLMGS